VGLRVPDEHDEETVEALEAVNRVAKDDPLVLQNDALVNGLCKRATVVGDRLIVR